jgi:hypothetical protein
LLVLLVLGNFVKILILHNFQGLLWLVLVLVLELVLVQAVPLGLEFRRGRRRVPQVREPQVRQTDRQLAPLVPLVFPWELLVQAVLRELRWLAERRKGHP